MVTATAPVYHFNLFEPMDISAAKQLILIADKKPVFEWDFDESFKTKAMKEIRTAIRNVQNLKTIEF